MDFDKIVNIIDLGLICILLLCVIFRVFWGLRYGMFHALVRLGVSVGAIFLTITTFKIVFAASNSFGYDKLMEVLAEQPSIKEAIESSKSGLEYLVAIVEGLMGPTIFIGIYTIWASILGIVSLILRKVIKSKKPLGGMVSRIIGAVTAVITTVVVFFVWLMPVCGYLSVAPTIYDSLTENAIVQEDQEVSGIIKKANNVKLVKWGADLTSPLFKLSTTVNTKTFNKIDCFEDVQSLISVYPYITQLKTIDFSNLQDADLKPIDQLADKIEEIDNISLVLAEILSVAGTKWYNNEEFLTINLKQTIAETNPEYANALDGVLLKLSTCTKDNISSVVHEFTSALKSSAQMINYLSSLQSASSDADFERLSQQLTEVLSNFDRSTVELLAPAISSDLFVQAGLPENQAEIVADVLVSTIETIAEMNDEEIARESLALNTLVTYVVNPSIAPDSNEVIEALIESEVVIDVIETYTDNHSEETDGVLSDISDETKQDINHALDSYVTENPETDISKINAIKSLFGIE